jgi:hypothetical protein
MEHLAIDLGGKESQSQICVRRGDGQIVEERRCRTAMLPEYLASRSLEDRRHLYAHTPSPAGSRPLRAGSTQRGAKCQTRWPSRLHSAIGPPALAQPSICREV